jgi:hypothetical protein
VVSVRLVACALALAGCTVNSLAGTTPTSTTPTGPSSTSATTSPKQDFGARQLLAGDGRAGDNFGGALWFDTFEQPIKPVYLATPGEAALSADGTVAVVGSPGSRVAGQPGAGAVYVFAARDGRWSQVARLTAADAAAYDALGWSVAISGDGHEVLAGAPYDDAGSGGGVRVDIGAAYFFHEAGGKWSQVAQERAATSAAYDSFGWSVGLSRDGGSAIVGATGHDVGFLKDAGSAYVFRQVGNGSVGNGPKWAAAATLTANPPTVSSEFGGATALSADGSTAAVTQLSQFDAQRVLRSGATFIFGSRAGWATAEQLAQFADPNRNPNGDTDAYGVNVVLSDDGKVAAVAAPDVNIAKVVGAGATYVYSTTGDWRPAEGNTTVTLLPRVPAPYGYYGSSVALSADGSVLLVGVDGAGTDGQGAAELVQLSRHAASALRAGTRVAITATNSTNGRFATSVALSADGTTALATAPWVAVGGADRRGAAYVLTFPREERRGDA